MDITPLVRVLIVGWCGVRACSMEILPGAVTQTGCRMGAVPTPGTLILMLMQITRANGWPTNAIHVQHVPLSSNSAKLTPG